MDVEVNELTDAEVIKSVKPLMRIIWWKVICGAKMHEYQAFA
ncbi:MAG: hypothetical protein CM15mP21_6580 [Hyphomicrobiales bacterium]|nr:MAG: hypothetical protein CM15mP21_6580 [Hyphomicrobiales bacterium]